MGIINVLDVQTANLIAAGEVVERPASAVKELLENSIDAGANKITLEIKNGGISLIRISDDGCGMSREDALVCTKRHATSKIKTAADLDGIATLGFRGEALAAISSVSEMRIMTKTESSLNGIVIKCSAGQVVSVEDAGCPNGTTIIIEELFANVPARRKFLKRDVTETAAVSAVIEKIALSRPDISFKFITDGNVKFSTTGDGDLLNVIYSVLGRDFAKKSTKIHDMTEGIEVEGYIGNPESCRGNRNYENFFINGRYVKCLTAAAALEQAFSSYIPSDRFPCCVINIKINPAFVDVNVHPQKTEVKFSNDKLVFNAVYCSVKNALLNKIKRPEIESEQGSVKMTSDSFKFYSDFIGVKADTDEEANKIAEDKSLLERKYEQIMFNSRHKDSAANIDIIKNASEAIYSEKALVEDMPTNENKNTEAVTEISKQDISEISSNKTNFAEALPWFKIVGVVFNTYIFVELEDKMLIIDKHAAHERIIFEKLRQNLLSGSQSSQLLLFPITVELDNQEIAVCKEYKEEFVKIGFDFALNEQEKSISIIQYPSEINSAEAKEMLFEIISRLCDGTGNVELSRETIYEKALYQASCKAAVKGGREDLPETVEWITEKVLSESKIRYCPHGRPVAFEMTKKQFEKRFERI